nr:response regulator transcription factor [Actinomadura rupiterrae]
MCVLVVDDEPAVREGVVDLLELEGYRVESAADGAEALRAVELVQPDAVVLDVLMPGMDGLEVCRRLRAAGDRTPILVLTARDSVTDRVDGLDVGADDYLVKPFAPEELRARVRALLRRAYALGSSEGELTYGDLTLDPETRRGRRGDRVLEFSETEFALLELLVRNAGQVLPHEVIMERVWGCDFGPGSNSLAVYIGYLRRKLGEPKLVRTVRGVGYVLDAS